MDDRTLADILPLVITNDTKNLDRVNTIYTYIMKIIMNPYLDTMMLVGPYISEYFIDIITRSPVNTILVIIDKNPPKYTEDAMQKLHALNFSTVAKKEVQIRQRPKTETESSRFLHAKLMIPYFMRKETKKFYSPCAVVGSVNFTKNGLKNNDEIMVILRDEHSINECVEKMETLWTKSLPYPR